MSRLEPWRLFSSNLVFTSAGALNAPRVAVPEHMQLPATDNTVPCRPGEMVFGFGLLYYLRTLERQMGTAKYTVRGTVHQAIPRVAAVCVICVPVELRRVHCLCQDSLVR